jgi:hypothetical protein
MLDIRRAIRENGWFWFFQTWPVASRNVETEAVDQ